ncbi:2-dehydropantoate 2-reductase [Archaeoglobales archaeon]|nr:MAG: 2-dehydropantoate 2-reductase [Archaeoglobales archaeon]
MLIQVFGAGALGSLFGYLIQKAGYNVVFVARGKQLEALNKKLVIKGLVEDEVNVNAKNKPVDADVTFVTVKAYDTENAAKLLSKTNCGIVCSLQNGVGNEEILSKYVERVVGGVTTYGANLVEYGVVEFAGKGVTFVGDFLDSTSNSNLNSNASVVAKILNDAGIETEVVDDIRRRIWVKAVINAAINPITALCNVRNGKVVEVEELWNVAYKIAREGEEVMKALEFNVKNNELVNAVKDVAMKTKNNRSSMLQDFEKGKRTEIEFINGAIVKAGRKLNVDVSVNEIVLKLIRGAEVARGC